MNKNSFPLISLIIRTCNEERWIPFCLDSVFKQDYPNFEIIIVDNNSKDSTLELVQKFPVARIEKINEYLPGKALNIGIRASKGEYIVCLSGHCIPVNSKWLSNLFRNFNDKNVAAVYGRQEPLAFTPDSDKRDLSIVFGLDKRIHKKDSFFHNANSMLRKDLWEKIPFDERATNIEDRIWAHKILQDNYVIIYEPEASVYHYHGIHQDGNKERCYNVVRIIESLNSKNKDLRDALKSDNLNTVAIIPAKGDVLYVNGTSLIAITIKQALSNKRIKKVYVTTDDEKIAKIARDNGAVPFLREESLSRDYIDLGLVYSHALMHIEEMGEKPDLVVTMESTFPFRPKNLIDNMIERLLTENLDSIVVAFEENKSIWKQKNNDIRLLEEGLIPRKYKEPVFIGLRGAGFVTYPDFIRTSSLYGSRVGLYEINDQISRIEIRSQKEIKLAEILLNGEQL